MLGIERPIPAVLMKRVRAGPEAKAPEQQQSVWKKDESRNYGKHSRVEQRRTQEIEAGLAQKNEGREAEEAA